MTFVNKINLINEIAIIMEFESYLYDVYKNRM